MGMLLTCALGQREEEVEEGGARRSTIQPPGADVIALGMRDGAESSVHWQPRR